MRQTTELKNWIPVDIPPSFRGEGKIRSDGFLFMA